MKVIVYTCNFGNHEKINPLMIKNDAIKYIYFTDNDIQVEGWKTIKINKKENTFLQSRYYKINSHIVLPKHDISIYVDASFDVHINNVEELINKFLGENDILQFKHPRLNSNCLYTEGNVCINKKLVNVKMANKQLTKYKHDKFPVNFGLYAGGFIIRKNNEKNKKFNELWWNEVNTFFTRDQLSEMYCIWKSNLKFTYLNGNIYNNKYITYTTHRNKIFIDCGGFDGCSVRAAKKKYDEIKIYTFEPDPRNIKKIKELNTVLFENAVSNEDGEIKLFLGLPQSNSLYKEKTTGDVSPDNYITVKSIDLAKWIKKHFNENTHIIIKLNVEGSEYDIIPRFKELGILNWINEWYVQWHWNKVGISKKRHDYVSSLIEWKKWNVM